MSRVHNNKSRAVTGKLCEAVVNFNHNSKQMSRVHNNKSRVVTGKLCEAGV